MDTPRLNLLTAPLIRIRDTQGQAASLTLPELFVALTHDTVRDYPALRPHQRHPWHSLLVQLAALALHQAGESQPWETPADWQRALLALTPNHPDGAAFCLVSPHDQPAFLQPPVPGGSIDDWKKHIPTPDALDMLVTSKNHDLKGERMRRAQADDWLFALTSLQTQEGVQGNGKRGISRMNSGFGSRAAVGLAPRGATGRRWLRDVQALLNARDNVVAAIGLSAQGGIALLWLPPWNGTGSIQFTDLDPFYIEICRRIRLTLKGDSEELAAYGTTSKTDRICSDGRNGITGDAWLPIETEKALTLPPSGFNYRLLTDIVWGSKYHRTVSLAPREEDGSSGIQVLAQGITRGNGKTAGYHERRIPLSKKAVSLLRRGQSDLPALLASQRIAHIASMHGVLRGALLVFLEAGRKSPDFDRRTAKQQVEPFVKSFERTEDARFFDDLNTELEADSEADRHAEHLRWLIGLAERAEDVLRSAFAIGPQCGERRYRARSRALSYFHGALRSGKHFPELAQHLHADSFAEETAP